MATPKEILEIGGREVSISNPQKVYFPDAGYTKLDLVHYYLAVADGALTGIRGRPMALKRFVDGITKEPFFQKRAPDNTPDWIRTAELTFPSGRTADEIVVDDAAALAWIVNLGCIDLNPHPVRADDLDHPDELRVDLDPVPGVEWPQIREVALACREALEAVGLVGWPKTSGSRGIHINVRIARDWTYPEVRRAALALARDVERRVPDAATSKWWKEERHGVFLDYNQNAKDRTVASAYSVRPLPDARVSTPLTWDEVPTVEAEAFTIATVPARFAAIGDPGAGIDDAVGSLEALLELSRKHEAEGEGDAPWPPNYAKQAGEPPRVQPSRKRRPDSEYEQGRGESGGPPPEVAAERAAAVAAGDPNAGLPTEWEGSRPTPTGRRKTNIPVIEISRAASKAEALEGPRALEGPPPQGGRRPGARRRARRRDARALVALVSGPGQSHPRPRGRAAGRRRRSTRTTTRGQATSGPTAPASWSGRPERRNRRADGPPRALGGTLAPAHAEAAQPTPDERQPRDADDRLGSDREHQEQPGTPSANAGTAHSTPPKPANEASMIASIPGARLRGGGSGRRAPPRGLSRRRRSRRWYPRQCRDHPSRRCRAWGSGSLPTRGSGLRGAGAGRRRGCRSGRWPRRPGSASPSSRGLASPWRPGSGSAAPVASASGSTSGAAAGSGGAAGSGWAVGSGAG